MRRSFTTALALVAALAGAGPVAAQQQEWTAGDEDRSTIMEFFEQEEVGSAAESMGYDVQELGERVLDLSDESAALVAGEVRNAEQAMAAQTITFTVTTLIIILLVVILLILVLD